MQNEIKNLFEKIDKIAEAFFENKYNSWQTQYEIDNEIQPFFENFDDFFEAYLQQAIETQNADRLEFAIIFAPNNKRFLSLFQKAFLEDWHGRHEDIISIFEQFSDKSSLQMLYQSFQINYTEHQYNKCYSLHKKIMWAIYKIEGKSCREQLLKKEKFISPALRKEFKQFLGNIK